MEGLGGRVESAVDLERRVIRVGAGDPEMVARKGLKQAPLVENADYVGAALARFGGYDVVLSGADGREESARLKGEAVAKEEGRRRSGGV